MPLNREQILAKNDTVISMVAVPEWGGDVYVRTIRVSQRDGLVGLDRKSLFTKMLILTMCDENGVPLGFTDEDIVALEEKSLAATVRVFAESMRINGMTKEAIQEAEKNSATSTS